MERDLSKDRGRILEKQAEAVDRSRVALEQTILQEMAETTTLDDKEGKALRLRLA